MVQPSFSVIFFLAAVYVAALPLPTDDLNPESQDFSNWMDHGYLHQDTPQPSRPGSPSVPSGPGSPMSIARQPSMSPGPPSASKQDGPM
jgi:hypothetical protein